MWILSPTHSALCEGKVVCGVPHRRDLTPLDPGNDLDDLPYFGKRARREQDIEAPGLWNHEWVLENNKWQEIVQAYMASIAAVDHEVGRVVRALEKSEHADNTVIVLFSDHGWHLGEKQHWGKAALWEQTTRVPMIFSGPGISAGIVRKEPVELLSLYPTLLDFAEAESPSHVEGVSLMPLLAEGDPEWSHPAVTTFSDHHALRTERWRYIRYEDGSEELYDHESDPHEWDNLATRDHEMLAQLRKQLDSVLQPGR